MPEAALDDAMRGQLRQRIRVLRVVLVSRGDVDGALPTLLAELELLIRRATAIAQHDPGDWLRDLDRAIEALEAGDGPHRLGDTLQTIAGALRHG
jgi:hypothetical protein